MKLQDSVRSPASGRLDAETFNYKVVRQFSIMTIVWGVVAFGYAAAITFGLYRGRKHTAVEPVSATN